MKQVKLFAVVAMLVIIVAANIFNGGKIQAQDKTKIYKIGDISPTRSGIVFYDKGMYSDGWRYLEVRFSNLSEIEKIQNKRFQRMGIAWSEWGCRKSIPGARGTGIGMGKANTQAILEACGNITTAAKKCIDAFKRSYNKKDKGWFMPSKDELNLIYIHLHKAEPWEKRLIPNDIYWSSTEDNAYFAWNQDFRTGVQAVGIKDTSGASDIRNNVLRNVLMIRAF